jgi:hypothetical protein
MQEVKEFFQIALVELPILVHKDMGEIIQTYLHAHLR